MEAEPPASSSSVLVPLHCSNEPTFPGDGLEPGHCIPGLGSACTPQRGALMHFEVLWCWITVGPFSPLGCEDLLSTSLGPSLLLPISLVVGMGGVQKGVRVPSSAPQS